jgi:hypothetical protein
MRRLIIFALALVAPGCAAGPSEDLPFTLVEACLQFERPTERVFRTEREWLDAHGIPPGQPSPFPAYDFNRDQIAGHFDGGGSACTSFGVDRVVVDDGMLVIHATRYVSTQPCILILAHPQVMILTEKRDEPVRFDVREVRGETAAGPVKACR